MMILFKILSKTSWGHLVAVAVAVAALAVVAAVAAVAAVLEGFCRAFNESHPAFGLLSTKVSILSEGF